MGWTSSGESLESHQHHWINDRSQIDVLIPTNVGQTAAGRRGATGGTTLETRGGQALDRAELVTVEVADEVGQVPRPNMAGALVIKAASWTNLQDRYRDRHLTDFALLGSHGSAIRRVGYGVPA
jgi:acyl-coenzyme A synthetase/AMP-(fatty) acid ligase